MRRKSDQRCAQALDFGMGGRKRLQFENTKGAPVAAKKADDHRTAFEKMREVDEAAATASEPERRRCLAGLYGLGDEVRFGERLDRAPRGINHVWFGVRLVFATACYKLRLQRHGAAPGKRCGHLTHLSLPMTYGTPIVVI